MQSSRLITINGVTTLIGPKGPQGEMGVPGLNGRDGKNGKDAPTKEEILMALRNDPELMESIAGSIEWNFEIERDENNFLKSLRATSKIKDGE